MFESLQGDKFAEILQFHSETPQFGFLRKFKYVVSLTLCFVLV